MDRFGIRLTGVGGTGVVTVSQVLANAGLIAGWSARSLDQTGLAQKGGAVVSDVVLRRKGSSSNKLGAAECDLYLGCDLLVAADPGNLRATDPAHTVVVLSTSEVPTGRMVSDPDAAFPEAHVLAKAVADRGTEAHMFDARELSVALFGDDQFANMVLLGAGYQSGGLPLPATAIEEAITLNGVAAAINIQAFRRGRQFVLDQASLWAAAGVTEPATANQVMETVDALIARRAQELMRYANAAYARRYTQEVARIADHEAAIRPGSTELTRIAAESLFKLMAYKDEYEVARLHLDTTVRAGVIESFGPSARVSYNLLPPSLRTLGLRKKVRFGPWFRVSFRVLYAARGLRATRLDPFGRAEVRRVERAIVSEYVDILHGCGERLDERSFDTIATLLGLPDMVRGFEEIKLRNVDRYRQEVAVQLTNLRDLENHGSLGAVTGRTGGQ